MVDLLIVECFQSSVRSEIILCTKSQDDFFKRISEVCAVQSSVLKKYSEVCTVQSSVLKKYSEVCTKQKYVLQYAVMVFLQQMRAKIMDNRQLIMRIKG